MKHVAYLVLCASLISTSALAEPPTDLQAEAAAVVTRELVEPLKHRSTAFSRVPRPAQEMRVRILDSIERHDVAGAAFFTFAIDSRRPGKAWRSNVMKGCVYTKPAGVYVRDGEGLRGAKAVVGDDAEQVPATACQEARS